MIIEATIFIKVVDPKKAYFEVQDYQSATISLASSSLRSIISDMGYKELLKKVEVIGSELKVELNDGANAWGIAVEKVDICSIKSSGWA